ncbi:imidazole glycerol phosphate synthase subunit HisH [Pseudomonadales bacterium]|nr:imidazole glycerol phosphate synthase subunit HisH [Pseudomonadales bacterium]
MSQTSPVVIVDYGMGNIWSVYSALRYLGANPLVSADPDQIASADVLVLPGVGSFHKSMLALHSLNIAKALDEAVLVRKRKILGICLGMQLFAERGEEDGDCTGLGYIPGTVERFSRNELGALKLPHIGFNLVNSAAQSQLFKGIPRPSDFYFVHSYRLSVANQPGCASLCNYGADFLAAYEHENIFATQFHPEKSQTNGLKLLKNFLAI